MVEFYEVAQSPPCRAVRMTANLLGIELKTHTMNLFKKEQWDEEYLKVNPFHLIPAIIDQGFHLSESRAIMLYFVNKYAPDSPLYPKDPVKRAVVDQILFTDNGTVFPAVMGILRPQIYFDKKPPEEAVTKAREVLTTLETVLANRTFSAGEELTLADVSLISSLSGFDMGGLDLSDYPVVRKYVTSVKAKLSPMYAEVNDGPVNEIKEKLKAIK